MGLRIDVRLGPWSEVRSALENGKIDMLAGMFYSEEREKTVDFSVPHTIIHHSVFVRKDNHRINTLEDLRGKEIIVQKSDIMHDYAVSKGLSDTLVLTESPAEALRLLSSGRHDCALLLEAQGLFLAKKYHLTNISTAGPPFAPDKYCFAANKGDKELLANLDRGIGILKATGRYNEIHNRWVGVLKPAGLSTREIFRWAAFVFVPLLLLLMAAALWSWSLRRQVRQRTYQLSRELNDRELAEKALRDSEEKYRVLVENADEAIFVAQEGMLKFVNKKTTEMTGYTKQELASRPFIEFVHPDDRPTVMDRHVQRQQGTELPSTYAFRIVDKSGGTRWVLLNVVLIEWEGKPATLNFLTDITERKHAEKEREKLQAQLLQAQKMESVGRLAGGVAHDFNNMLGIIIGNAELAAMQTDPDELAANLQEILKASRRAADTVGQLLGFARKQTISPRVLDLSDTVSGMLKMLRRLIREDIELRWIPGEGVGKVRMDPTQINQILANLLVNSRDAIPGVGKITIESANATLDEDFCLEHAGCVPGEYVLLTVRDTGTGMTPEVMEHLFDPFFTTKGVGKGTGLGLATVYGIVKQNNGFIDVHSEPGEGTTFKIYLPKVEGEAVAV